MGTKIKPFSLHNFMQTAYAGRILNDFKEIFTYKIRLETSRI
mgnify:CR=1 FL=1